MKRCKTQNRCDQYAKQGASDEILAKLDLLKEIGSLYDELKKISWYRFSTRNIIKGKLENWIQNVFMVECVECS